MSDIPVLYRNFWSDFERPFLFNQNFGMGLFDDDMPRRVLGDGWNRPLNDYSSALMRQLLPNTGISNITRDKNKFQVNIDTQHFKPEEIQLKTKDNILEVQCKHEERSDDHGFVRREFTRKYTLPKDVKAETVTSTLSPTGILTIEAPIQAAIEDKKQKEPVPIPVAHM